MNCSNCGHANPEDARFCSKCGQPNMAAAAAFPPGAAMSPVSAATAAGAQTALFDEEAWRAVIGKNGDYYLPRFRSMAAGGATPRWHWPAFFVTWYWMLHRKMWGISILYLIAPYIAAMAISLASRALGGAASGKVGDASMLLFMALFFIGPPLFANRLYFRHCRKTMNKARAQTTTREGYLGFLTAKGGTGVAVLIIALLLVLFIIGILAAVAIPAFNDFNKRAKVAEGIAVGRSTASAVVEHYERTRQFPHRLADLPGAPAVPPGIGQVSIDPGNGEVSVPVTGIGVVKIRPRVSGGAGGFECSSPDIKPALRPQSCR